MELAKETLERINNLTLTQMRDELVLWSKAAIQVQSLMNELMKFRVFASTPEELQFKINQLIASIELKDNQIKQLMDVIGRYRKDPIGVGFHIDQLANTAIKLN